VAIEFEITAVPTFLVLDGNVNATARVDNGEWDDLLAALGRKNKKLDLELHPGAPEAGVGADAGEEKLPREVKEDNGKGNEKQKKKDSKNNKDRKRGGREGARQQRQSVKAVAKTHTRCPNLRPRLARARALHRLREVC
jgi:hypothetical protein